MKKLTCFLLMTMCFAPPQAQGQDRHPDVTPPERIVHNHKTFSHNDAWADREMTLIANLDADADNEIVIGFMGIYVPPVKTEERSPEPFSNVKPRQIPIEENQAFYLIYDKDAGGHYRCVKTLTGMDRIGSMITVTLDPGKPDALMVMSPGGENYTEIRIYRWQEGGYRLLFNDGAPGTADLLTARPPVSFRLGPKKHVWNGNRQRFETSRVDAGEK